MLQAHATLMALFRNPKLVTELFERMETSRKIHQKLNTNEAQLIASHHKNLKVYAWCFTISLFGTALAFVLSPYFSSERTLIFDGYVPENQLLYSILFILEHYISFIAATAIASFDLVFAEACTSNIDQFSLLQNKFRQLFKRARKDDSFRNHLKQCIDHHCYIFRQVSTYIFFNINAHTFIFNIF